MFKAFPIINLIDQEYAVNSAIQKNNLTRTDILLWLQIYGTVECYSHPNNVEITLQNFDDIVAISVQNNKQLFVYKHSLGHFDVFNFMAQMSKIEVMGRGWIRSYIY